MSLLSKLKTVGAPDIPTRRPPPSRPAPMQAPVATKVVGAPPSRAEAAGERRVSNGLKEFLWQLEGISRVHLLDFGPAWQNTLNFFIDRGFKVYTEDLLATWKNFLDADDRQMGKLAREGDRSDFTPAARAERFVKSALRHPPDSFDAVLLWDSLDYLDADLVSRLVSEITPLVRDGGVVLALFHARTPQSFHRYRIADAQNLEVIPAASAFSHQRIYQNREITNLFRGFRSSRMFVGRDQIREGLFVK